MTLESENLRLQTEAVRADRERVAHANHCLQAELDENAPLRKDLEEARAKLDAIANIEVRARRAISAGKFVARVRQCFADDWYRSASRGGARVDQRINILYMMDTFKGTGGTERHVAYLVGRLPRERFQCTVVVLDLEPNRWVDRIRSDGTPVIHVPVAREYGPMALARALQLARLIRSNHFDIVQTYHQKSDTYGALVARLAGVRHLVSSKRDAGAFKKRRHYAANRMLRGLFDRVIVVADAIGELVAEHEAIPSSRIVRIYNGVDTEAFMPPTPEQRRLARARLGFGAQDFVVGTVARFRPEKAYEVFFAGALAAAAQIPTLRIVTVGDGSVREGFRARYASECAQGRIQMLGDVSDVTSCLHALDVGCLIPAANEGFSNSVLEKMAVGLPLIVTDVGGNSEAVVDGDNGIVIPPRDAAAFQRALTTLYADPDARTRMGVRSRELVEEKFAVQRMCDEHEALYLSLMQ